MKLESLTVINKAARLMAAAGTQDAAEETDHIMELCHHLYGKGNIPFQYSKDFPIPLHLADSRIRGFLANDIFSSNELWGFLCARENLIRMITATELEKPAAEAMAYPLTALYCQRPEHEKDLLLFKQNIGYMIRVIMELQGYIVEQKRVKLSGHPHPETGEELRYFSTASRYRKLRQKDIQAYLIEIDDAKEKSCFAEIAQNILKAETLYQKGYALGELTNIVI